MADEALLHARLSDLSGFTHFVASRQGLFVVGMDGAALFATGSYFGITVRAGALYAFEHRDRADAPTMRGRIVRFDLAQGGCATVLADGLGNGCHQIDFIGDALHVVDTYAQRILVLGADGGWVTQTPLPQVARTSGEAGYAHINAITARAGATYILLHNCGAVPSEIAALDADFAIVERRPLARMGCHNIVLIEDGEMLSCGSADGLLISDRGLHCAIIPGLMTRGLSVDDGQIAIGSSLFGPRASRHRLPGAVSFLDRSYRTLGHVAIAGAPTEIRRIDGRDLSLANYQPRIG